MRRILVLVAIALVAAGAAAGMVAWHRLAGWRPSRSVWTTQGAWIAASDAPVDFALLKADGAGFVYHTASIGSMGHDGAFADALDGARAQGLAAGAVHVYDACAAGDAQAANFMIMVPRDARLLPPAVAFDLADASCPNLPGEAALQSELTIFLNQVERHVGKAAILMPTRDFEGRYHLGTVIHRQLWLIRDYFQPDYEVHPAILWTANSHWQSRAARAPLRWVVATP